jgi:hypothetical protein
LKSIHSHFASTTKNSTSATRIIRQTTKKKEK